MSIQNINSSYSSLDSRYVKPADLTAPLSVKAPLDSPALTGIPTVPTAAAGTNTVQIASTAFVQAARQGMIVNASLQSGQLVLTTVAGTEVLRASVTGPQGTPGDVASSYNLGTISSSTLDLSTYVNGGVFRFTLATNITSIVLPSQNGVQRTFELVIKQDATGSRTIAYPTGTLASEGIVPVLSTAANATDKIALIQDGANTEVRLVARALS